MSSSSENLQMKSSLWLNGMKSFALTRKMYSFATWRWTLCNERRTSSNHPQESTSSVSVGRGFFGFSKKENTFSRCFSSLLLTLMIVFQLKKIKNLHFFLFFLLILILFRVSSSSSYRLTSFLELLLELVKDKMKGDIFASLNNSCLRWSVTNLKNFHRTKQNRISHISLHDWLPYFALLQLRRTTTSSLITHEISFIQMENIACIPIEERAKEKYTINALEMDSSKFLLW